MNLVHMLLEICAQTEELSAGAALERFQLKMNRVNMQLEMTAPTEELSTGVALVRL